MAKLIYFAPTSLDGYIADEPGNYDWAAPDDAVHAFINDLERPIGMYLYGQEIQPHIALGPNSVHLPRIFCNIRIPPVPVCW
jgi:hypothetical protein